MSYLAHILHPTGAAAALANTRNGPLVPSLAPWVASFCIRQVDAIAIECDVRRRGRISVQELIGEDVGLACQWSKSGSSRGSSRAAFSKSFGCTSICMRRTVPYRTTVVLTRILSAACGARQTGKS